MKELVIISVQSSEIIKSDAFALNEFSKFIYIVNERRLYKYSFDDRSITLINDVVIDITDSKIISLDYILELDALVIVQEDGNIGKIKEGNVENMGAFDSGIRAAVWSPSQEQLIVVCGDSKLVSFDTQLDPTNEITLDRFTDSPASISFKNDAKFFSLNYAIEGGRICCTYDSQLNQFKTESKSDPQGGLVQSVFEKPQNFSNLVAWQPNANQIASVSGEFVIFWEKNGLRHLEFKIEEPGQVQQLQWNKDGSILTLVFEDKVSIYTRSNFKWYQKLTINKQARGIQYLDRQNQTLMIITSTEILFINLGFAYNDGLGMSRNHKNLYLTDFSKSIIPPPLFDIEIQLSDAINLLYFDKFIFIHTSDGKLHAYDYGIHKFTIDPMLDLCHKMIFVWNGGDNFAGSFILVSHQENQDLIIEVVLDKNFEIIQIWKRHFTSQTQITAICMAKDYVILQSRFGERFHYYPFSQQDESIEEFDNLSQMKHYDVSIRQHHNFFINLKNDNKLYLNNHLLSDQCTSFRVYEHFLAFTANTQDLYHLLYVIDLNKPISVDTKSISASNVERGARIVQITKFDRLILQVPRGNFEILAPRLMSLYMCQQLHEKADYKNCYESLRRHKLDLNLLYDFDPEQFQRDIVKICELNQSFIQIFIQALNNVVSVELQYAVSQDRLRQIQVPANKVNLICQAIIDNVSPESHLLTIITAMLKKTPSEVEQALQMVVKLKSKEEIQIEQPPHLKQNKKKKVLADQALEYICWLADANKMYEVALSTYDFELVKQVATHTQKDPKEYLPQLEKFQAIQNRVDMMAAVQMELKNYDQLITVLSQGTKEQQLQAIEAMKKYERFRSGLEAFKNSEYLPQVKEALGEYLLGQKQLHQASLAFESGGLLDRALKTSLEAHDTKRVLSFKPETIPEWYLDQLKETGKWKDCGRCYEYLNNIEQAIYFFAKAEDWKRVAKCTRLVKVDISNQLNLAHSLKMNQMIGYMQQFNTRLERLKIVQQIKKERGILAPTQHQADFDAMSDVSLKSGTSKSSYTMSVTTGIRKKKNLKDKSFLSRNIKEGSPVEEEYLVEVLKDIQKQSAALITQIKSFQNYLVYFNEPNMAHSLSLKAKEYLKCIGKPIKTLAQTAFEEANPQVLDLYKFDQQTFEFSQSLDQLIK